MSSQLHEEESTDWPVHYMHIVPRMTGGLSAISSFILIYLIFRSETKLGTIYHRVMLCISICDITSSVAMALASLPFPTEMPMEEELGIEWPGLRLGDTGTCTAQGFLILFGSITMHGFNTMLCLYYACAIAFQMKEEHIRKYIQPIMFGLPLIAGLSFPAALAYYGLINPPTVLSIGYWCTGVPYPTTCQQINEDDGGYGYGDGDGDGDGDNVTQQRPECIRGNLEIFEMLDVGMSGVIMFGILTMVLSLSLVIRRVIQTQRILRGGDGGRGRRERTWVPAMFSQGWWRRGRGEHQRQRGVGTTMRRTGRINDPHTRGNADANISRPGHGHGHAVETPHGRLRSNSNHLDRADRNRDLPHRTRATGRVSERALIRAQTDSKVIILQSIAYISAYTFGLIWILTKDEHHRIKKGWFYYGLFMCPINGFFNLLVFLSHKVYNYRRIHTGTRRWDVIKLLFSTPLQEPCFVSRVEIVAESNFEAEMNNAGFHLPALQIRDEMGNEEVIRMNINNNDYDDDVSSMDEEQDENLDRPEEGSGRPKVTSRRSVRFTENNLPDQSPSYSFQRADSSSGHETSFGLSSSQLSSSEEEVNIRRKGHDNLNDYSPTSDQQSNLEGNLSPAPDTPPVEVGQENFTDDDLSGRAGDVSHTNDGSLSRGGLSGFSSMLSWKKSESNSTRTHERL